MISTDVDILCAGAGCAGLSLAVHLATDGPSSRHVTLLDPRAAYEDDRTWSSFRTHAHLFEGCVTHRWHRVRVAGDGRVILRETGAHPYEHVPSRRFYEHALARVDASPRVDLSLGVGVRDLEPREDHVLVRTDRGELTARLVLDSRPPMDPAPRAGEVRLLQCFEGWFLRAERPVWDPSVATLMDFEVPQAPGVHFLYVLPFAEDFALVEDTHFAAEPPDPSTYRAHLQAYMESLGVPCLVERVERGRIPMSSHRPPPTGSDRIRRVGLAGGFAKPSTGYAFDFVQRHAGALARELHERDLPLARPPRGARAQALDAIFLAVLERSPARAPALFADLFERVPTPSLVRFLTETSSMADQLRVMGALPSRAFLEEALVSRRAWLPSG